MSAPPSSAWSLRRRLVLITGFWCCFAILLTINNFVYPRMTGRPITWAAAARFPLINYTLWSLLTPPILLFCERLRRRSLTLGPWLGAHCAFSVLVLFINAAAWIPFTPRVGDFAHVTPSSWRFVYLLFWQSAEWNIWMYWVIVGISHGLDYYFGVRDANVRAAQLETQLTRAELQCLQAQLHPHFLFNTLNLVSSLIESDRDLATDVIGDLGTLLRIALENNAAQETTLAEELSMLDVYLRIQRLRFDDRLIVRQEIDPGTLQLHVPRLIMQPLVENAFRHGLSRRIGDGELLIESTRDGDRLMLRVADNGPGNPGWDNSAKGIGLRNARARLQRLYGRRSDLIVHSSPTGFSVQVLLPILVDEAVTAGVGS